MNIRLELVNSGQHMKIPRSLTYHMSSLSIKVIENASMRTSSTIQYTTGYTLRV